MRPADRTGGRLLRRTVGILATLVCLAALAACKPARPPSPGPNAILISIDTLRADHLGCYGYARPTSPHLDRFAASGAIFERAVAESPWTMPSHASLLTGLAPSRHGMLDDMSRLADAIPTLAERVRSAGVQTAAFVNTPYLDANTGLMRGFDSARNFDIWDDRKQRMLSGAAMNDALASWLDEHGDRPFFAFFHTYDLHSDYLPAARYRAELVRPYAGRFDGRSQTLTGIVLGRLRPTRADIDHIRDLYDAALRQLDDNLGALFADLERRGLLDTTLVVVTSDHGEEFFEHGNVGHGRSLYQEMVHVPLIVRGPGVAAGRRIEAPVQLVDVAPTLLDWFRAAPLAAAEGRGLASLWANAATAPSAAPRATCSEVGQRKAVRDFKSHLVGVVDGDLKLVHDLATGRSLLFDLRADPDETRNLASERQGDVERLRLHVDACRDPKGAARDETEVSPETRERLRSLGYAD
jgi:arylsulfatase A-like enzyme